MIRCVAHDTGAFIVAVRVQLREEMEAAESKLRGELRRAQSELSECQQRLKAVEESRAKKVEAVKELKAMLATSHMQVESGKLQIQQLSTMLGKLSRR